MKDMGVHLLLFFIVGIVVVLMGALYGEADDSRVLKALPRRLLVFILGCGAVAAVMLILERTLASVD